MESQFTCNICNGVSVIGHDNTLYKYGCDYGIHTKAEKSAPSAGLFKCQVCKRTELKTKYDQYHRGCNMFERHKDLGIVGFHDVCFKLYKSHSQQISK